MEKRRPHWTRRVAGHGGKTVLIKLVFVGAILGGVELHANTPRFRRLGQSIANGILGGLFEGKLVAGPIEELHLGLTSSIRLASADIVDPEGGRVIHAEDLRASVALGTLLRKLVGGGVDVRLSDVSIARADVVLDRDREGNAKIGDAFASPRKDGAKEEPPAPPASNARAPRVLVPPARIGHLTVHGDLVPPALDGDADDVTVAVTLADDHVVVALEDGKVTLRKPRAPNQQLDLVGHAKGSLDIALDDVGLVGKVDLVGSYGDLPVVAHATIDHDAVTASVDVARTEHAHVRSAFTGLPITAPVEVHAKANGTLPLLALSADATVGAGTLHGTGELDLREGNRFLLDADVAHLDVAALGQGLTSDLTGRVHGEGVLQPTPIGTFSVTTVPGTVETAVIPATVIAGRFEAGHVVATVRASEGGVDATGKVEVDLATNRATFDLQGRSPSLRSLSRAPNLVGGVAGARVQGTVDLAKLTVKATASANGTGLSFDAFRAKQLDATATITGPLTAPVIDASFHAQHLALVAEDKRPLVYPEATGKARITLVPTPTITNASVTVATHGEPITITADTVSIRGGAFSATGLEVAGVGEPLVLDVRGGEGAWRIRAKSPGIDLRRVGHVAGIEQLKLLPDDARAAFDIDVAQGPAGAEGHVTVGVESKKGLGTGPITTEAQATITKGRLHGRAKIVAEGFATLEIVDADVDVPRRLDGASLARTTGTAEWRGQIDLSRGAALFAGEKIERVGGTATLEGRVERGDPAAMPMVRATVRTANLEVVYGDPSTNEKSTTVSGIDLLAHASWDGRNDDTELALVSWDQRGVLASASAKSKVPVADFVTGAKQLDGRALGKLEVDAIAQVPGRPIQSLPDFLEVSGLRGRISGLVTVAGNLAHPRVAVTSKLMDLREERPAGTGKPLQPFDGVLEARWDGEHAGITFSLDERDRSSSRKRAPAPPGGPPLDRPRTVRSPAHVRGLVLLDDLRMTDLLRGRDVTELPWRADGEIELDSVNLGAMPFLSSAGMQGTLSGRLGLRDVHRTGSFDLKAHLDDFGAGGAKVQSVDILAGGRNASLYARATLRETSTTSEASEAIFQVVSQSPRVAGVHVDWDPTSPTRVDYAVRNARLALLTPLFKSSISELDGRANGAGSVTIDANGQVFEGGLAISGGRLYVNTLGEEITGFDAIARFDRSGAWRIDDATGKMGTGEFKASANGHMKGLQFVDASAKLVASRNIPISSEAATFAEATGEVSLAAKMSEDRKTLLVDIEVPKTNVQLPDRSAQNLQPLDADPTISVGVRRGGKLDSTAVRKGMGGTGSSRAVQTATKEALVTKLNVSLGKEVHLEGRGLDVNLGGKTVVELAEELRVTGRIDLRSGTIEVHGRRFTVDRGTVTFPENGEPTNPTVVAAAYWDSPDRTRVLVEFTGPLKTGKLSLRSEPAYSKNEILSVLLFGRPDPNMATGATDKTGDASGATAVGTGFVASDLNMMLSEIDENLDIETDTLSGNRARTKLGRSFFDRRLKVQVGYAPGRTYREPDTTYLFLNWQFIPQWSLVATRGDRGTSILDVLFQHRY